MFNNDDFDNYYLHFNLLFADTILFFIYQKSIVMQKANALTAQCLVILAAKGFYCWRQNNAAVYDATKKVYRSNSATKGIPDILGFNKTTGKFICVEIKVGKDRLSIYQIEFLELAKKATCHVFVVKTTDDIESMAKSL